MHPGVALNLAARDMLVKQRNPYKARTSCTINEAGTNCEHETNILHLVSRINFEYMTSLLPCIFFYVCSKTALVQTS